MRSCTYSSGEDSGELGPAYHFLYAVHLVHKLTILVSPPSTFAKEPHLACTSVVFLKTTKNSCPEFSSSPKFQNVGTSHHLLILNPQQQEHDEGDSIIE